MYDRGAPMKAPSAILKAMAWSAAWLVVIAFTLIVGNMLWHGLQEISWEFLTTEPRHSGRAGGIGPILVATLLLLTVCLVVAVPVGLATAILLAEFSPRSSRLGRLVRRSLDTLAGVPSIVFGLFGSVFFCRILGLGFSIAAGGLTLACMILPLLTRATEEGLRAAPDELRSGAASLGFTRLATIRHLILPAAVPGLLVGLVLGIGRAAAETAALIFTSGYVDRMPESLLDSGRSLSIHIYDLSMNVPGGDRRAYATGLVLVALLLTINSLAATLASRWLHRRTSLV